MAAHSTSTVPAGRGHSVAVIGVGAIGSCLVPLLGHAPGLRQVAIVDPGSYEAADQGFQQFAIADTGKPKASVQAVRLRRVNPKLAVRAYVAPVEQVPLGRLRADVLIAGLDSRRARMSVNQVAWRLGVPWIDAAVSAADMLVRVAVYRPDADQPCLECAWGDEDYAAVEQVFPCGGRQLDTAPTRAPVHLGAVAAALQVGEFAKLVRGDRRSTLVGKQLYFDLQRHVLQVSSLARRATCRFDHERWAIERLPGRASLSGMTLADLFAQLGSGPHGADQAVAADLDAGEGRLAGVSLPGHAFTRSFQCPVCGQRRSRPVGLVGRLRRPVVCRACQNPLVPRGAEQLFELSPATTDARDRRRCLRAVGFRPGDVVRVRAGTHMRYIELDPVSTQTSAVPAAV